MDAHGKYFEDYYHFVPTSINLLLKYISMTFGTHLDHGNRFNQSSTYVVEYRPTLLC